MRRIISEEGGIYTTKKWEIIYFILFGDWVEGRLERLSSIETGKKITLDEKVWEP